MTRRTIFGGPLQRRLTALMLAAVTTVAGAGCSDPDAAPEGSAAEGAELATSYGCASCHSTDGTKSTGPTWKDLWGERVTLADGTQVTADDEYIARSITDPSAEVVDGFSPIMPAFDLSQGELAALTAYIRSLGTAP